MPYIYKTTFPNGKIYIGSDITDSVKYLGSPKCEELILKEHSLYTGLKLNFEKEILIYFEKIDRKELLKIESEYIQKFKSNDSKIGYNLKI